MGHVFSIDPQEGDLQKTTISYNGVLRVLRSDIDPAQFGDDYCVLKGSAPADQSDVVFPARYCSKDGKTFMECTGRPECNGGPPPSKAAFLTLMIPGEVTILVKDTVKLGCAPEGQRYLYDTTSDPEARIPVFHGVPAAALSDMLQKYCQSETLDPAKVAFHIYQIRLVPDSVLLTGGLRALVAPLIAIPVSFNVPDE